MKIFLTLLNIALIGIVIWRASGFFKSSGEEEFTVGRDRAVSTETATRVTAPAATPMSISEAGTLVTRYNLFNLTRCPDAVAGRGASRPQMTLLGIYKIGNSQGAIIQQRAQQQRGPVRAGTNQQQAEKLYFQVGEVMNNGYTVAAIDSGKVTLSRSGSTLELQLETAGRNINTTGQTQTNRQPNAQQIQQMMMMGQMRMMGQMMQQQNRMMQQQQQQQQQQNRQGQVPARNTGTAAARGR